MQGTTNCRKMEGTRNLRKMRLQILEKKVTIKRTEKSCFFYTSLCAKGHGSQIRNPVSNLS